MADMNKHIIMGHLAGDSELLLIGEQKAPLIKLRVVTNYGTAEAPQREYHDVEYWGSATKEVSMYRKGYHVYIEGPSLTKSWEDTEGKKHYRRYLKATNVSFLGFGGARPGAEVFNEEDV